MRQGIASTGTLLAAAAMAILVGTVFFLLQDYGPESALRKFHRAVLNRDIGDLRRVVTPDSHDESINALASMVDGYARSGARYRLRQVSRQDRRFVALVEYVLPNRLMQPAFFWVVEKSGGRWRVDVDETLMVRKQMYGI